MNRRGKREEGSGKSKTPDLTIGRYQTAPAVYVESDPRASEVAAAVGSFIEAAAAGSTVEHIGSTAVPGLGGKGVIDLMLLYPPGDLVRVRDAVDALGFQRQTTRDPFPEERPMRVGTVNWKGKQYRIHLHILSADSAEVADLRTFRDRLRNDSSLRESYAALKRAILARGVKDSLDYWKAKSSFWPGGESWRAG